MKRRVIFLVCVASVVSSLLVFPFTASAQNAAVKCGDIIKGELTKPAPSFNESQVQAYPILLSLGDKVTISGQADGASKLHFGVTLDSPAGTRIFPRSDSDIKVNASPVLVTGRISAYGLHTIYVFNSAWSPDENETGTYQIAISCELNDGTVIAAGDTSYTPPPTKRPTTVTLPITTIQGNSLKQVQCGDVIAAEFTQNEQVNSYIVEMAPGDLSFQVSMQPFGDGLWIAAVVNDAASKMVAATQYNSVTPAPQLMVTTNTPGNYRIFVGNTALRDTGEVQYPGSKGYMGGIGIYTFYISCVLKGNTIIAPDPAKIQQAAAQLTTDSSAAPLPTAAPAAQPTTNPDTSAPVTTAQTITCAGSPTPRLFIGAHGKVTPGDANNLREEPSGKSIAKMPAGSEFDVIDGPLCGRTNLTFWKVQYGDLAGWTAEGEGAEYWLEPLEDGRG